MSPVKTVTHRNTIRYCLYKLFFNSILATKEVELIQPLFNFALLLDSTYVLLYISENYGTYLVDLIRKIN